MRGDDNLVDLPASRAAGRPPRARGRRSDSSVSFNPYRKTPACAGTTSSSSSWQSCPPEDPRVRGDDSPAAAVDPSK